MRSPSHQNPLAGGISELTDGSPTHTAKRQVQLRYSHYFEFLLQQYGVGLFGVC